MKSIIIFVHSKSTPSSVPKLPLHFSSSTSSQPSCHFLSFGSFLSSFFTPNNLKFLSFKFRNPNPKLQGSVKTRLESPREFGKNEMEIKWTEQVPKNRNPNLQMSLKLANLYPRQFYRQEIAPNILTRPLNRQSP